MRSFELKSVRTSARSWEDVTTHADQNETTLIILHICSVQHVETYVRYRQKAQGCNVVQLLLLMFGKHMSSAWRQKGLTGYCFKYIDRPFCLRTDDFVVVDQLICSFVCVATFLLLSFLPHDDVSINPYVCDRNPSGRFEWPPPVIQCHTRHQTLYL